jgi:hypothetical protein
MAAQLRALAPPHQVPPEAEDWELLDKAYEDAHRKFLEAAKSVAR